MERLGRVPVVGPGADPKDQGMGRFDDPGSIRLERGRVCLGPVPTAEEDSMTARTTRPLGIFVSYAGLLIDHLSTLA